MADYKNYSELEKTYDYDKKKATVLAEAVSELVEVKKREAELERLIKLNNPLKKYLWGTADGKVIAFHDIEDDHLKNILTYLPANNRETPDALKAEARSRGFELPAVTAQFKLVAGKKFANIDVFEVSEDDDYDESDRWDDPNL